MSAYRTLMIDFLKQYAKTHNDPFAVIISKEKRQHFAKRILSAIERKEKIFIFGDYDVDGMASTALIVDVIKDVAKHIGVDEPSINWKIPARFEHYGIDRTQFEQISQENNLVITIDNGSHNDFFSTLSEKEKENILIFDHHPNGNFENELCVINPNTAGNVAIATGLLIETLFQAFRQGIKSYGEKRPANHYHDLVAMTLLSDVASLNNSTIRAYVESGIKKIAERGRLVFSEMLPRYKGDPTVENLSFEIIPMLNSIGRMSDAPSWCVDLLLADSKNKEMKPLIEKAKETNSQRKEVTDFFSKKLIATLRLREHNAEDQKLIFVYDEDMPIGINGIVAANIFNTFGIDTIVASKHPYERDLFVGSGRGVDIKNKAKAIMSNLEENSDVFHYGGHNKAIGVKIKDISSFEDAYTLYNRTQTKEEDEIILKQEKIFITEEPITIDEYMELSNTYYELTNSNIKFNDEFYVYIRARIVGFHEYRNGFAKITAIDDKLNEMTILSKVDPYFDYYSCEKHIFSAAVKPIEKGRANSLSISFLPLDQKSGYDQKIELKKGSKP